jgi:hypothetical protein
MKKVAVIALAVMASVVLAASVMAQSAVKDECVALCKDAAKFLNEKGFYPAVFEINKKEGKFVSKSTYVFLVDLEGHLLAHPFNLNISAGQDRQQKGRRLAFRIHCVVKPGRGWTEYIIRHRGEKAIHAREIIEKSVSSISPSMTSR